MTDYLRITKRHMPTSRRIGETVTIDEKDLLPLASPLFRPSRSTPTNALRRERDKHGITTRDIADGRMKPRAEHSREGGAGRDGRWALGCLRHPLHCTTPSILVSTSGIVGGVALSSGSSRRGHPTSRRGHSYLPEVWQGREMRREGREMRLRAAGDAIGEGRETRLRRVDGGEGGSSKARAS